MEGLGFSLRSEATLENLTQEILKSSEIEGEILDREQVRSSIARRTGMARITVGAWRDDRAGPMQVVSGPIGRERVHYEAPQASRLPNEMTSFLEWFNGGAAIDPVLKAVMAHLWFVTIHPLDDGNGRIAQIEKCSQDTALRDIDDLVARDILRKEPAGGRSTSYSLVEP